MEKIVNEIYILAGPEAAEKYALERGLIPLAAALHVGSYIPQVKGFGSERARARSEASHWLARRRLLPPRVQVASFKKAA